ncbi:MAG TPA: hypothetical protein VK207_00045 [Bacteroidales bacterium]|nr:hypothetical protein [Bacteroidales bacterium]
MKNLIIVLLILCFSAINCGRTGTNETPAGSHVNIETRPFRVLVIIGDQWTDPMSYSIDPTRVKDEDFLDVVTMLKIWGVPFDILRLDEQRLQINRFLDSRAKANYGCMIWMADPNGIDPLSANYETLKKAVNEYGISLIALSDYIRVPAVAELCGIEVKGIKPELLTEDGLRFTLSGKHFISSDADGLVLPDKSKLAGSTIPEANGITLKDKLENDNSEVVVVDCTAPGSIETIGHIGDTPQFTIRDIDNGAKAIWIGGGHDWFRKYPDMRRLFRKALVYSIGYGLFNDNFENGFICIMDDVGCAEHSYSLTWHYPTPAKDTLIKYLIEPLEKYGFMMVQNITPGFANKDKQLIESSWDVPPFTDIFGNYQDYQSTKEGLDEGLRRGVFEIQPHRAWSHMNWDLESPPGPFWGKPDGEMRITDWYNEVVDVRRDHAPVPSNDLLFIYKMGIEAVREGFGVTALAAEVRPGAELVPGKNGGYDNGRIAAIAGIGVSRECYVGIDHTIEFKMMMPDQFTFHDLDLTARTNYPADQDEANWDRLMKLSVEELTASKIAGGRRLNVHDSQDWIESRKDKHWMGFNETCAYLHTLIENEGDGSFGLQMRYDDHYCRHFEKTASSWTLELSDELRDKLAGASLYVDNNKLEPVITTGRIEIPAGLGNHTIEIK